MDGRNSNMIWPARGYLINCIVILSLHSCLSRLSVSIRGVPEVAPQGPVPLSSGKYAVGVDISLPAILKVFTSV